MPPVSPNTKNNTGTGAGTNSTYRFYNVQKEEKGNKNSVVNTVGKTADGAVKTTGTALQATGAAVQVAGLGIQLAGSATRGVGTGVSAIGMGLSATGVGAVVGAPINAVGRVIGVGGSAIKAGGKITSMTGKGIRKSGGAIKKASRNIKQTSKRLMSVAKFTPQGRFIKLIILGTLLSMWFLQFSASLFSLGFLGLASGLSFFGNLSELLGQVLSWVNNIITSTTGISFNPAEHMASLFVFFNIISFIIGICSLFFVALIALFTAKSPFWGEAASIKISVFILSFVFLAFPIFNMIPWAVIWMWAIDNLDI